jgi:spermidine synthase
MKISGHSIETSDEAGVRFLHFGSEWVQGAMRIARPWALELEYTREMMLCLAIRADEAWPKRVLQIGLGAASLTKFLYRHRPDCHQTIVEINPGVVAAARSMFKLPEDSEHLDIHIADGIRWMKEGSKKYDLIIVDGYDENARFGGLGSEDFYRDCAKRLSNEGLLTLNLFGRSRGYSKQIHSLNNAFNDRVLALPANPEGNAVAFAAAGEKIILDLPTLHADAKSLSMATGLKLNTSMARLDRAVSDRESGKL